MDTGGYEWVQSYLIRSDLSNLVTEYIEAPWRRTLLHRTFDDRVQLEQRIKGICQGVEEGS